MGGDLTIREVTIQQFFGETRRTDPASRHRRAMIEKVWAIWIAGVLQPSLPDDILVGLGLTEQPAMVARTLDLYVQRPDLADQVQAPGTRLLDVFDRLDRALLILGAPGAGKTTLLLTLARDLLIHAAQDPEQPIPVVFPLSSWVERQRPLAAWLVDALNEQYDVPRKTGQAWVDADQILPLLDGLDEVQSEHRAACAETINTFRQEHGLLPLAVSCRTEEYEALGTRLRLHGALAVQPLTRAQVHDYLNQVGPSLAVVRDALQKDPRLWELLNTPLMLTILTAAYSGQPNAVLPMHGTLEVQRQQLFPAYVKRMFQRRAIPIHYSPQCTKQWLAWLAWQMTQHSQNIFYLERMQPDWLPQWQRWWPTIGLALTAGLVIAVGFGLAHWPRMDPTVSYVGPDSGTIFMLSPEPLKNPIIDAVLRAWLIGSIFTVVAYSQNIVGVEIIRWSWSAVRSKWRIMLFALGPSSALVLGFSYWLPFKQSFTRLVTSLGFPWICWLIFWGISSKEFETHTAPNEGIYRSARNALALGLCAGLVAVLGAPFVSVLDTMLFHGLLVGPLVGLYFGGRTCLQHFILRLLLIHNDSAPWRYVDFLDYAAERILLRKVGSGYSFIHRLLQDHFASLYEKPGKGAH